MMTTVMLRNALVIMCCIVNALGERISFANSATVEHCARTNSQCSLLPDYGFTGPETSRENRRHGSAVEPGCSAANDTFGWEGPYECIGRYCVYTNNAFGGGISIITTYKNSQAIFKLSENSSRGSSSQCVNAQEVPGKGIGLVANNTIKRGDAVMSWLPTLVVHLSLVDELNSKEQAILLDAAVARLPGHRRNDFFAQVASLGGHRIRDILFTNSFQLAIPREDGRHFANFPAVSRFNHDCRPK
jgi:hypothetical protein